MKVSELFTDEVNDLISWAKECSKLTDFILENDMRSKVFKEVTGRTAMQFPTHLLWSRQNIKSKIKHLEGIKVRTLDNREGKIFMNSDSTVSIKNGSILIEVVGIETPISAEDLTVV